MKARILPPDRTIAKLASGPGGVTVTEAVAAAERGIRSIETRGRDEVAQTIARIQGIGRSLAASPEEGAAAALYADCNVLVGVAGAFGLAGIGDVAFSLCALLEQFTVSGTWRIAPVQLHLDALAALQAGDAPGTQVDGMVAALRQVVERARVP